MENSRQPPPRPAAGCNKCFLNAPQTYDDVDGRVNGNRFIRRRHAAFRASPKATRRAATVSIAAALRDVLRFLSVQRRISRPQKMNRIAGIAVIATVLGACSMTPSPTMTTTTPAMPATAAAAILAPSGKLRAAINFGNPILALKDPATGEPRGVSVDLARELGRRLGVPVELVHYTAAGKVVDGIKSGEWDVGFVAIDPVRAADMDYTAPYVIIEGAYLVPQNSPIKQNAEVDREGVRVVVGTGSAYDLYLTRELKKAKIIRAPTSPAVVDTMVAQSIEVAAGVKQQLEADARRIPGVRLLEGRFMVINQAMAAPKGRAAGVRYLAEFIEEMKASGFVANALKRYGIEGAAIAPAAAR
jgi:polar amino acid transport system substrate-binding protein